MIKNISQIHIFFAIILILGLAALFIWVKTARASIGNLQIYSGSAEISRNGKAQPGSTGSDIHINDTIKIPTGSKVAIVLKDSSVIRLDEDTEVEVGELKYQDQKIKNATFKLTFGRLWSRVAPLEQSGNFEVETPTVVATVRGTSFNTTYKHEFTSIYVDRDSVDAALLENRDETQAIDQGFFLKMQNDRLKDDFQAGAKVPPEDFFDDWIRFNQAEDDKICKDKPKTPGCENYNFERSIPSPTPSPSPSPTSNVRGTSTLQKSTPKTTPSKTPTPTIFQTPAPSPTSTQFTNPTPTPTQTPTSTPIPTPIKKLINFVISHDNAANDCYPSCQFSSLAYFSDNPNLGVDVTKQTQWSLKSPYNGQITSNGFYTAGEAIGDVVYGQYNDWVASHTIYEPTIQ